MTMRTVAEVMNRELFYLSPSTSAGEARAGLLALSIGAAPVLDGARRPVGLVSLRGLVDEGTCEAVGECAARPVATVAPDATLEAAARLLAASGQRRLVVVDDSGRALGIVSAIDLLRGLVGAPSRFPAPFPHLDDKADKAEASWSDEVALDDAGIDAVPDGGGVLALVAGGRVVWAEATGDLRMRLVAMTSLPETNPPALGRWLERPGVRVRALLADETTRERVAAGLRAAVPAVETQPEL